MSYSLAGCRWRRVGARIVDYIVSFLPAVPLIWLAVPVLERSVAVQARRVATQAIGSAGDGKAMKDAASESLKAVGTTVTVILLAMMIVSMTVLFLYDWLAGAVFGRTLGKFVFGLRVVHSGHGGRPGIVRSFLRAGLLIGVPLVFGTWAAINSLVGREEQTLMPQLVSQLPTVGLLLVILPAQRALHDFLSGTEVTRA